MVDFLSQKTREDGGAMVLDSHGGYFERPGEGEDIQPGEEDHQDWEDASWVLPFHSIESLLQNEESADDMLRDCIL